MKELGVKIKNFAIDYYNRAHKIELFLLGGLAVTLPYALFLLMTPVFQAMGFGGSWYISCDDYEGHSYNLEVPTKPYVRDGFIFIDGQTFITTKPMSTCAIIPADEAVVQIQGKLL